jgi:hypothetical protein
MSDFPQSTAQTPAPAQQTPPAPETPASTTAEPTLPAPAPERDQAPAGTPGQGEPTPKPVPENDTPESKIAAARDTYRDWPTKDFDGPQPWDLQELGLPRPGHDAPPLEPGARDTITPIVVPAGTPMLAPGTQGEDVRQVAVRLGELGYENTISRGNPDNAFYVFDDSVSAAVDSFRRDYNVREDPSSFLRDRDQQASTIAGPWTVYAIVRASDKLRAEHAG